jgi:hypothetical protein
MNSFDTAPAPVSIATSVAATTADDFFSFDIEPPKPVELPATDAFMLEEVVVAVPQPEAVPTATGFEPVGEEEISFEDEEPAPVQAIPQVSTTAEDDFSSISFDEPFTSSAAAVPPPLPPLVEMAPPAPLPPPIPEPVMPAFNAAPAALDEAQLRAILSTASRELIERIVWEVVPDLAETIIKEEIRKLKAGIA